MKLRHKFYAHRELNINRHQLHVQQNFPAEREIELITQGQSKIMLMYRTIDLCRFSKNICLVGNHLSKQIEGLKKAIVLSLSDDQRKYLLETDIDELRTQHLNDGNMGMTIPFDSRVGSKSKNET